MQRTDKGKSRKQKETQKENPEKARNSNKERLRNHKDVTNEETKNKGKPNK